MLTIDSWYKNFWNYGLINLFIDWHTPGLQLKTDLMCVGQFKWTWSFYSVLVSSHTAQRPYFTFSFVLFNVQFKTRKQNFKFRLKSRTSHVLNLTLMKKCIFDFFFKLSNSPFIGQISLSRHPQSARMAPSTSRHWILESSAYISWHDEGTYLHFAPLPNVGKNVS